MGEGGGNARLAACDGAVDAFASKEQRSLDAVQAAQIKLRLTQRGGIVEGCETVEGGDLKHDAAPYPLASSEVEMPIVSVCPPGVSTSLDTNGIRRSSKRIAPPRRIVRHRHRPIGSASCRERVCQDV